MMGGKENDKDQIYLLFESRSLDPLQDPLKRSTRLKYNCISVSSKLIVIGTNTGGIYIFSRNDLKLLQIAFADKVTNSVSLVQISPNERMVAFSSVNSVHVVDMKLDTRSRAETLRSSDISGCITCLHWDSMSSKLYIGDDLGRVSLIPVSSNKAKNLFSSAVEVILRLDSMIVQLDKVDERILVSTLTRCYLCDTSKQQFSQIGKKLREGQFGACFLSQQDSAAMIYCARPGSRFWEVDYTGTVMNTHQFKQLLATPPAPIVRPHIQLFEAPPNQDYGVQAVSFPRLKVVSNNFLISWTSTTLYVLDPLEVKVILWSDSFEGIQDVCSTEDQVFIFFQNMQLQCLSILSVSKAIECCLATKVLSAVNYSLSAAHLILHYKDSLETNCLVDLLKDDSGGKLCQRLTETGHEQTAEQLKEAFAELEKNLFDMKVTAECNGEVADVDESLQNDNLKSDSVDHNGSVIAEKQEHQSHEGTGVVPFAQVNKGEDTQSEPQLEGDMLEGVTECAEFVNSEGCSLEGNTENLVDRTRIHTTNFGERKNLENNQDCIDGIRPSSELTRIVEDKENLPADHDKSLSSEDTLNDLEKTLVQNGDVTSADTASLSESITLQETDKSVENADMNRFEKSSNTPLVNNSLDVELATQHTVHETSNSSKDGSGKLISDSDVIDDDAFSSGPHKMFVRRPSATSLSSLSSAEITFDQPESASMLNEQIAIPVKRRSRRKVRKHSSIESAGESPKVKDRSMSPQGSIDETMETDCVPVSKEEDQTPGKDSCQGSELLSRQNMSTDSSVYSHQVDIRDDKKSSQPTVVELTDNNNDTADVMISIEEPDNEQLDYVQDRIEEAGRQFEREKENELSVQFLDSLELSASGEFCQSGELGKSLELGNSGNYGSSEGTSPSESQLSRSTERQLSLGSGRKVAFRQLKDKMQTKVTAKTKKIMQTIKDKNLLTKAKELAENFSQIQGQQEVLLATGGLFYVDDTHMMGTSQQDDSSILEQEDQVDSIVEKSIGSQNSVEPPIDLGDLEAATSKTLTQLEDLEILMDPDATDKILSQWITILNLTFFRYHEKCRNQSYCVVHKKCSKWKKHLAGGESKQGDKENSDMVNEDIQDNSIREDQEVKSATSNTVIDVSRQCVIYKKSFCYTKDPLCLPPDLHAKISELAQACFDVGCHGNVFDMFHFHCEKCITSAENCLSMKGEGVQAEKCQCSICFDGHVTTNGCSSLSDLDQSDGSKESPLEINEKETSEEGTESNTNVQTEISDSSSLEKKRSAECSSLPALDQGEIRNHMKTDNDTRSRINSLKHDCYDNTVTLTQDEQVQAVSAMAYIVRLYFPYLSPSCIRDQVLKGSGHFEVWSALMDCLQELSMLDREKYGVDQGQVIQHILDSRAMTDPGVNLLGHIGQLLATSSPNAIQSCVRCFPNILPVDVLFCCQHYGVSMETFSLYIKQMLEEANLTHRSSIRESLYDHPCVRRYSLQTLLTQHSPSNLFDDVGRPRAWSHEVSWDNQTEIDQILDTICRKGPTQEIQAMLDMCQQFGYWKGVLALLHHLKSDIKLIEVIIQLDDIRLLCDSEIGFQPESDTDWENVVVSFSKFHHQTGNRPGCANITDWTNQITWDKLGSLLVRHLGPDAALALLEKHCASVRLSTDLFKTCLMAGVVSKQQRSILHSMLEKVDTYLWSERPTSITNKLHYLALTEKQLCSHDNKSAQDQEKLQILEIAIYDQEIAIYDLKMVKRNGLKWVDFMSCFEASGMKADKETHFYLDEPDNHWGIQVTINKLCPCCNISLKMSVSHEESGTILFPCGHGYHKLCLPGKLCIFCNHHDS